MLEKTLCCLFFDIEIILLVYIHVLGFPGGTSGKELAYNAGDVGSISELGRTPGVGNDNSFQYCFLKNSMERGACWATVHVVPKSQTWLNLHKHNAYIYWPFLGPSFLLGNLDFPLALFIFWPKNFLNVSCNEVYCWGILWLLNIWKSLLHISFEKYFWGVLKSRCTIFFFWIL